MTDGKPPKRVTRDAGQIREMTGCEPVLTETAPNRWRLVAATDRVELTACYKKAARVSVALVVDGKPRRAPDYLTDTARVFRDPDVLGVEGVTEPVPRAAGAGMPLAVRAVAAVLARKLGAAATAGTDGSRWVIGVSMPGVELRLFYTRAGRAWQLDTLRPLQLVKDGQDLTVQAEGSMSKALALMTAPPGEAAASEGKAGAARATRSNAVEARRFSVVREYHGMFRRGDRPCAKG
jgi:hypothetical protein